MNRPRAAALFISVLMVLAQGCWASGEYEYSWSGAGPDSGIQGPANKPDAGKNRSLPPPAKKKDSGVKPPTSNKDAAIKPPPQKVDVGVAPPPPKKDSAVQPPLKVDSAVQPPPPKKDSGIKPPPPKLDTGSQPPFPLATHYKVAAVQYSSGSAGQVKAACLNNPQPNVCALGHMIGVAAGAGARFVVLPEYAVGNDQKYYEAPPKVGVNPGTDPKWPAGLLTKYFSKQAAKYKVYLVINLLTFTGVKPNTKYHNTNLAFTPGGSVAAVHHKFNLFGEEPKYLTPGNSVVTLGTPLGPMGLLVCADIYGDPALLSQLRYGKKARVVAFTSYWTTSGAVNWQADYAKKYGVYLIAANTLSSPGRGGGIYGPQGQVLAQAIKGTPSIVVAKIPVK